MGYQLQHRFVPWAAEDARAGAERAAELFKDRPPRTKGGQWKCKVCYHPNRVEIDTAILSAAMALDRLGKEMVSGAYDRARIQHHRDKHLLPLLGAPIPKLGDDHLMTPISGNAPILRKLEWYRMQLLAYRQGYMEQMEDGSWRANHQILDKQVKLLVEARNCDVLMAKFREGDGARPVNGIDGAKWERIKVRLSAALEGHPEAKLAVLEALEDAE